MPPPADQDESVHADMKRLAILVLTLNEQQNLTSCLTTCAGLGTIFVIDSGSLDDTLAIAERCGARIINQPWLGYARQRQAALDFARQEGFEWVLFLDADERLTQELRVSIENLVREPGAWAAGRFARRMVFLGRELRHAYWYPDYQTRLLRSAAAHFPDRDVHEHPKVDGPIATLRGDVIHEDRRSFAHFVTKHIQYAELEAGGQLPVSANPRGRHRFTRHGLRQIIKYRVWLKLPGRAVIRFVWLYLIKRGFLDGRPGFVYCCTIAFYDLMIEVLQRPEPSSLEPCHGTATRPTHTRHR